MNRTQPIKDIKDVTRIGEHIRKTQGEREYMMFRCMLYLALRTQDILSLKVGDLRGKYNFIIKEQKTANTKKKDKTKIVEINPDLQKEISEYTMNKNDEDYMFPSNKGGAISREYAFRRLQKAGKECGMGSLSGHVLRKTFCWHSYKNGTPLEVLGQLLNHSSDAITRQYIGLQQENIKDAYYAVSF